jgi:multiple sugar transport system ATP-binding protein
MPLAVENATKRFAGHTAVDHVSFESKPGEFVVLLGPSGCGKSTLLRLIAGLEQPDEGVIRIGGVDVTAKEPRDRDVAMVFQSYALYPHLTIFENIAYPLRIRKRPSGEIRAEVERVAARLSLTRLLAQRPRQLSGGERQRVALARAIVRHPQAFLMDEPLSNLDAQLRVEMRAELKHLQRELGVVTVYVTHDQAEAMTLAHRIAVLRDGKLEQFAPPAEIYHRPANVFVAGFVGSPAMNLIPGHVDAGAFRAPGIEAPAPIRAGAATLGIRPEAVEISTAEAPGDLRGAVYVTESLGDATLVYLDAGGSRLLARLAGDVRLDDGAPVWFRLPGAKLHWFDTASGQRIS